MKTLWSGKGILFLIIMLYLQGCGKIELSPKNVQSELGASVSADVLDCVDTTPPVIIEKEIVFQECQEVRAEDLVTVEDLSDVQLSLIHAKTGREQETTYLYPNESVIVKAVDLYGNETIKRLQPTVIMNEEEVGVPPERVYVDWLDFPYNQMDYVSEDLYKEILSSYSEIDWYLGFQEGDKEILKLYKEKYAELVRQERAFIDIETGEEIYLKDSPLVRVPDEISATYDMEQYRYVLFDLDGDDLPELCMYSYGVILVFKYDTQSDCIFLYKKMDPLNVIGGTQRIYWTDGAHDIVHVLNENGEEECLVEMIMRSYQEGTVFFVSLPRYSEEGLLEVTDEMKQQCYYDRWGRQYYYRVTEEQYEELTKNLYLSMEQAEKDMEKVTYTYEEFIAIEE